MNPVSNVKAETFVWVEGQKLWYSLRHRNTTLDQVLEQVYFIGAAGVGKPGVAAPEIQPMLVLFYHGDIET